MNISLSRLQRFYGHMRAELLLHALILREFPGTIGLMLRCDATSLIQLGMASEINPDLPLLLPADSRETSYLREAARGLGFSHIHAQQSDLLDSAAESLGWLAIITSSRQMEQQNRIRLDEDGIFRIHPLADWNIEAQKSEMLKRRLPAPLGDLAGNFYFEPQPATASATEAFDWDL